MVDADPEVLATLGKPEHEVEGIVQDMAAIRRAVADERYCQYSGKPLCHTTTLLVKVKHPSGRITTVAVHQDAWQPERKERVERHFGASNITVTAGADLFAPAA